MGTERPCTAEQLAALPMGPEFSVQRYEITDADRKRGFAEVNWTRCELNEGVRFIETPIARDAVSFWSEPTDTISWVDKDGAWTLGRYADGRWFKKRY